MKNYWDTRAGGEGIKNRNILFLRIRDLYLNLLKHLYNDPKDIPNIKIYFSTMQRTIEEGNEKGYPIVMLQKGSNQIKRSTVKDLMKIPNFENSYTWFQDDIFVVFDYDATNISPLQFITQAFCEELFKQIDTNGLKQLSIAHMYEILITTGVTEFFFGFYRMDINLIHNLSALTYEKAYPDSSLLFPRYDLQAEKRSKKKGLDIVFSEPLDFLVDHIRQIRKLMELSDRNISLVVSNQRKLIGLTSENPYPTEAKVRFWDHMSWTITFEEDQKISYYNGTYHIHPQMQKDRSIVSNLGDVVKGLDFEQLSRIESVIRTASRQRSGTIIIIGKPKQIKKESDRMSTMKNAIGIQSVNLADNPFMIPYLTSIDGALLMDTDCNCECIGVILDGDAVAKGSPARGARYNSTVNYIKRRSQLKQEFTGIVVSEDGTIDSVTKNHVYRLNITRR